MRSNQSRDYCVSDSLKKTSGSRSWIVLLLGTALMMVLLPFLLLGVRVIVKHRLEARIMLKINAIRQSGEPVTAQDFSKLLAQLPDSSNSALVYLRASSGFVEGDLDEFEKKNSPLLWILSHPSPSTPIPPDTKLALQQWIESNSMTLELVHQGAQMKEGAYPLDLSKGFLKATDRPMLKRNVPRLVAWRAILYADDERSDLAVQSLEDLFGLARSYTNHPYPIAHFFRESCLNDSAFAVERIIDCVSLSDKQLLELQNSLKAARGVDWLRQSIMFDRGMQLEFYDRLPKPSFRNFFGPNKQDRIYSWWHFLLYPQRNLLAYLEITDQYIATTGLPLPERLAAEMAVTRTNEPDHHQFSPWFQPPPDYAQFTCEYARSEAILSTAETAMAVQRYRLAHQGRLPADLDALVPTLLNVIPTGPTDGQPLQFKKLADGFVISTKVLMVDYSETNLEEISFTIAAPSENGARVR